MAESVHSSPRSRHAVRQRRVIASTYINRDHAIMPSHRLSFLAIACAMSLVSISGAHAQAAATRRALYPVGGGYDTALQGFAKEVARHAQGVALRIVVVPAAFADDPVLPEDPGILADDVASIQAACEAVVDKSRFPQGCSVSSVPLYVAADASAPSVLAGLSNPALNGVFFTGGDQGYAMRILANTPAEAALNTAATRGVVVGGTSAGAAIESYAMNAGYTDAGDSTTALQKASIDLWLGQKGQARGLVFGSRQLVIDEHVYSRGRLGRMINAAAQTADALGHGGLLGLGLDFDTGAALRSDRLLTAVSGVSSAVVVDFQTAGATYSWVGANQALSARHVLTHLLPPSQGLSYDMAARVPLLAGQRLLWKEDEGEKSKLASDSRATLVLGGDVSADLAGPVVREVVRLASAKQRLGKFVIVTAAYASTDAAQADADAYAQALVQAGWRGTIGRVAHGTSLLDVASVKGAAGVLFLGGDQALLPAALGDAGFKKLINAATSSADVVMFERAMSAAAGDQFNAIPDSDSEDDAIAAFQASNAVLKPGLGLVQGAAFEPRLQVDKRWGRLYGMGAHIKRTSIYGISESTAIVLQGKQARVLGLNPVVRLDARRALFVTGDNGALGAFNVLLDVMEPGERLN
jgi:cyanophycinase